MKLKAYVLNTAILMLVFAETVAAQSTKIKQLQLKAERGDAGAQRDLGYMYVFSEGVPQDYVQAH